MIIDLGNYAIHGYDIEENIPLPKENISVVNRTIHKPRMQQSITRMHHHRDLSIVRKHWQVVSEVYNYINCDRESLKKMTNKSLGRQINKFVKLAPSRLNEIRYELLKN